MHAKVARTTDGGAWRACRAAVESWHRGWAAARLAAWRAGTPEPRPPTPPDGVPETVTEPPGDLPGVFFPGALRVRLARDRLWAEAWPLSRWLGRWWAQGGAPGGWLDRAPSVVRDGVQRSAWQREVEGALAQHGGARRWLAVRREAVRAWRRTTAGEGAYPDAGPPPDELAASAQQFLDVTNESMRAWTSRAFGAEPSLASTLAAWGDPADAEALGKASERWARAAQPWKDWGFGSVLESRVRVAPRHRGATPVALAARRVPEDVWVASACWARGLGAERAVWRAVAEALALAGVDPALPVELRRAWPASVRCALGRLAAGWFKDEGFLKHLGLDGRVRSRVALRSASLELLELRLAASASVAPPPFSSEDERLQWAVGRVREALGFPVGDVLAMASLPLAPLARHRWRVGRASLALQWRLRERFDEDWWRNPRVAEPIRAAMHPGGLLSVEDWIRDLGGDPLSDAEAWVRACWG